MSPEGPFRPPGEEPDDEAAQPPRRYAIGGQDGGQQNPYASAQGSQGSQGQSPYVAGSGQQSPYAAGSGQSPYAAGSGQQSPYAAGSQPPATPPGSPPAAPPPVAGPGETASGPALGQQPGLWGTPPQQQPPPAPPPPAPPEQPPYAGGSGGNQGRLWGSPPASAQQPQPPWAQRIPATPTHRDPGPPGSPPGGRPSWQPPASPGPILGEPAPERGRRPLVIGGVVLLVLLLLGGSVGAYLLFKGGGSSDTAKPKPAKQTTDTKACKVSGVDTQPRKQTDCWRDDQLPMTIDEAWPQDSVKVSRTNSTENRVTSKVDADCGKVVVKEMRKVVASAGCRQVIRVTYYDANNKIVASAGVMTVRDRDSAEAVRAKASDIADSAPHGVVSPLEPLPGSDAASGAQITDTTKGSYLTFAQGHYVIWRFAAYTDKAAQTSVDQKLSDAGGILYLFASNAIGERDKNPSPSTSATPQPNGGN